MQLGNKNFVSSTRQDKLNYEGEFTIVLYEKVSRLCLTTKDIEMVKENLLVRNLTLDDESSFLDAVQSWQGEDLTWLTFIWHPAMSHEEHLKILHDNQLGRNIPPDFVASTMLYGFVGKTIIGRVHVRHALNPKLLLRGGHMGYSVAPAFRGKGYGFLLAKAGLQYLRENLKVDNVLITCDAENKPSIKIIEKLGARLENVVPDSQGVATRRYWV